MSRDDVIVVGNWFDDGWRPNARRSIAAIARHWGLPVVELTTPIGHADNAFLEKLWLDRHCEAFGRVIWFDRDIVVRYDCPNLLDIVAASHVGCVSSHQAPRHIRDNARSFRPLFEAHQATFDHEVDHLNTGVLVFDPRRHAGVFSEARRVAGAATGLPFFDESSLSLAIKRSGHRQLLDGSFNRCGIAEWPDFGPQMTDYIWHLCGCKSQAVNARIDAVRWQSPQLPVRYRHGV